MRIPLALAVTAAAVLIAGCGGSVSVGCDSTKTLYRPDVAFTFCYADSFSIKPVDVANTQGKVRALVALDDNNLVAVRQFAPREANSPAQLKASTVAFATQNGVPASAVRLTKRSGIDMATFKTATTVDGTNTANEEWVFPIGGATWQLECQSTPDQGDEVRKACDMALDSIKAK